jgi:hypothetical protein
VPLSPYHSTQVKSGEQLEAKVAELKAKLDDVTGNYNFMAQKVRGVVARKIGMSAAAGVGG